MYNYVFIAAVDDISKLINTLKASGDMVDSIWIRLNSTYNKGDDISSLLAEYTRENTRRDNYINILVNMYEAEIQKLKQDVNASQLTEQQKASIKSEMRLLEHICDKNIRGSSVLESSSNINPMLFKEILDAFTDKCPFVFEIVESLVISNPVSRNILKTNAHKILCGLQTLGFISNIRNSKTQNCFPLMFGLLCISYGAGERFIDMLQSMGLSLHWNTM